MCSVNENDIEDLNNSIHFLKLKQNRIFEKCNKCKEEIPCVVLRNKDAYCKTCFLMSATHKFKALLGKHKLIREGDKVLIHYEGGHPTTALLNLVRSSLDVDTPKKLRFEPIGLFIGKENFNSKLEYVDRLRHVVREMSAFNIPIYFTPYSRNNSIENMLLTDNIDELVQHNDIKNISGCSESLADDIHKIHERQLLVHVARKLSCKFIFTVEISSDIASSLLSNVALGRGAHIPLDVGFSDTRDEAVTILRPLRLFDAKELGLYNYFNHLEPVIIPTSFKHETFSIQNSIEKFVNELQLNYPATVTTILKTGDKLSMQNKKAKDIEVCCICKGPIEISSLPLTTQKAIDFSHRISTGKENNTIQNDSVDGTKPPTCFSCSKIAPFLLS